jgi:hypothetical protein
MTPLARMRAVIHEKDPWFSRTTTAWTAFGFELGKSSRILTGATFDPHGFVVSADPEATSARLWACFE